ncbi:glycosyltransferase family 2 protein [Persephonella sp.]
MEFLTGYFHAVYVYFYNILFNTTWLEKIVLVLPYLLFEFPFLVATLVLLTLKYRFGFFQKKRDFSLTPDVSVIVTAYNEGKDVSLSIVSLLEQNYRGNIEIIVVVDGAKINRETYIEAKKFEGNIRKNRTVKVIPKWERGGRASSLNLGEKEATGEIIMAVDGDTSFDIDMVSNAVSYMVADKQLVAMSGNLRIRNWNRNLVTRMQAIEYILSIYLSKQVLEILGTLNNISGAFGIFRKQLLDSINGWDAGTAEDLDITLRIKKYRSIYPRIKLGFAEDAIGLTDGPDTWKGLLKQRQRWDGDLVYMFFRKHRNIFNFSISGIKEIFYLFYTSIIQQFLLPVVILVYYIYLFLHFDNLSVMAIVTLIYVVYLIHTGGLFLFFVFFVSERKNWDIKLIPFIPLFPVYGFILKMNSLYAYTDEVLFKQHKLSSYVPPWVSRKSKF